MQVVVEQVQAQAPPPVLPVGAVPPAPVLLREALMEGLLAAVHLEEVPVMVKTTEMEGQLFKMKM